MSYQEAEKFKNVGNVHEQELAKYDANKEIKDAKLLSYLQEGEYTTVSVSFLKDASNRSYTYKLHNSLIEKAKRSKYAIVDTATGFKVVQINEVHENSQLDYSDKAWKWIVNVVDTVLYDAIREQERNVLKDIEHEQRRKAVQELVGDNVTTSKWGI